MEEVLDGSLVGAAPIQELLERRADPSESSRQRGSAHGGQDENARLDEADTRPANLEDRVTRGAGARIDPEDPHENRYSWSSEASMSKFEKTFWTSS